MEITIVTKGDAFSIVTAVLEQHGLSVISFHGPSRTVVARGSVDALSKLFGIIIQERGAATGPRISYEGHVTYPAAWQGVEEYVYGLDEAEIAVPHFDSTGTKRFSAYRLRKGYYPHEVAEMYNFQLNLESFYGQKGSRNPSGERLVPLAPPLQNVDIFSPHFFRLPDTCSTFIP